MFGKKKKQSKKKKQEMIDIDLMDELDFYRKPEKKKGIDQKVVIAGVFVVVAVACILFSPVFAVKEIKAEGASHFTTSELCERIGLSTGDNLFLFGKGKAEKILEENPYIADAKLSAKLPDTMIITVKERKVRGYVPYMGSYLYIDEEGRVLEVQEAYHEALPLVKGLSFGSFTEGEIIPVENPEALDVVLRISQMMEKYDLLDLVVEIDVSNPEDIYAYVNQVQIHLGNMENGDMKIKYMAEIMKTIPEEDRGILDLSALDNPKANVVFQYLT
ncbi:FtsQ-type POTRA domain-containing protein [Anaerotignum sp.]